MKIEIPEKLEQAVQSYAITLTREAMSEFEDLRRIVSVENACNIIVLAYLTAACSTLFSICSAHGEKPDYGQVHDLIDAISRRRPTSDAEAGAVLDRALDPKPLN